MRARTQQGTGFRPRRAPAGRHRAPRPAGARRSSQWGGLLAVGLLVTSVLTGLTVAATPGIAAADSQTPTLCSVYGAVYHQGISTFWE